MVSVCLPSDALLQHLPSYLGFFYLGCGVSLHGCSRKAHPLLLTLDKGYLLTAAPPDLERGIAPLGPLPKTQEKTLHMDITRWSTPKLDWLYFLQPKMEKLYTVRKKNKTGSWLWLRSWTPYCQIQTEIEESRENHWTIQVWPKSNPLWLYSGSEK